MAVLIEGISVVVRADAVANDYAGGVSEFEADMPNDNSCTDGELFRVGFMSPVDVRAYVERLEQKGLRYVDATGSAVNVVVVDQLTGLRATCAWAGYGRVQIDDDPTHIVAVCFAVPSRVKGVAMPAGWRFETSLTARHRFVETDQLNQQLEFVRTENGVDVYRDRATGQEFYVGRSQ